MRELYSGNLGHFYDLEVLILKAFSKFKLMETFNPGNSYKSVIFSLPVPFLTFDQGRQRLRKRQEEMGFVSKMSVKFCFCTWKGRFWQPCIARRKGLP